jgi:hypothetical protein
MLRAAGLPVLDDVRTFFSWRNGLREDAVGSAGEFWLLPPLNLISLRQAIDDREDLLSVFDEFGEDCPWRPEWFPFMEFIGGGRATVDVEGPYVGAVRFVYFDEWEFPIEFQSLGHLVTAVAVAVERCVIVLDPAGRVNVDDVAFEAIRTELGP